MYWSIDLSKSIEKPKLYICKPDKTVISSPLNEAFGVNLTIKLKGINELSFNLPYQIEKRHQLVSNPNINKVKFMYLVKLVYRNFDSYFIIQPPSESFDQHRELQVKCLSLEDGLRKRPIQYYKKESVPILVVANDALNDTGWRLGDVPSEHNNILTAPRTSFELVSKSVLEMLNEIADTFNLIVQFDTSTRKVNFYKEDEIGSNKGLIISDRKYLQKFLRESNDEEFCTRLYVFGKDFSINRVSLTGQNYIEDFSYFLYPFQRDENRNVIEHSDYMSDGLCHAILDYQDLLFTKQGEFDVLLNQVESLDDQLYTKGNEIFTLETQLKIIEDEIEMQKQYGNSTTTLDQVRTDKLNEINSLKVVIEGIKTQRSNKITEIEQLQRLISKEVNFTPEQLDELIEGNYIIIEEWKNENYPDEKALYGAGLSEFERRKIPPFSLELSIVNFLSMISEQKNWNKLNLGDKIRFKKSDMGIDIKANITSVTFNFDNDDITLEISNVAEMLDNAKRMMKKLYKADDSAKYMEFNKTNWNNIGYELQEYIDKQISEVNDSLAIFDKDLARTIADGFLTKAEVSLLKMNLSQLQAESNDLISIATLLNILIEKDNYITSLNELTTAIDGYASSPYFPVEILLTEKNMLVTMLENVQNTKMILSNKIESIREENTKEYVDNQIIEVNESANNLQNQINDFSSDLKLSLAEANTLSYTLSQFKSESVDLITIAAILSITIEKSNYETAINNLDVELNTFWLNKTIYPLDITETQRNSLMTLVSNVQSTKTILINKITEVQSQAGKDADVQTKNSIRNPNPINEPIVANDGTAIDHVVNTDGSVDISFEWIFYENSDSPINGFGITVFSSDNENTHNQSVDTDKVITVDKKSRVYFLQGVPANKYYSFGVFAYRNVDTSINPNGIIRSTIAIPSFTGENPYQPKSNVEFKGDLLGTIDGIPYDRFRLSSATYIIGVEGSTQNPKRADHIIPKGTKNAQVIINDVIKKCTKVVVAAKSLNSYVTNEFYLYTSQVTQGAFVNQNGYFNGFRIRNKASGEERIITSYTPYSNGDYYSFIIDTKFSTNIVKDDELEIIVSGGKVVLLDGEYILNSEITIQDDITLEGLGNSTIIRSQDNATNEFSIINSKDKKRISIKNLQIECGMNPMGFQTGISLENTEDSTVDNLIIKKFNSRGMHTSNSKDCTINNSIFEFNSIAINMDSSNGLSIINNTIRNNGISITGKIINSHVIDNNIYSNESTGVYVNGGSVNNKINGNTIRENEYYGILLESDSFDGVDEVSKLNIISNNTVSFNKMTGIEVRGDWIGTKYVPCIDNQITNNIVIGNSQSTHNYFDNITLTGDSSNNIISGNVCRVGDKINKPSYGIRIAISNCKNNIITNNDLKQSGASGAISDSGTGTKTVSQNYTT